MAKTARSNFLIWLGKGEWKLSTDCGASCEREMDH